MPTTIEQPPGETSADAEPKPEIPKVIEKEDMDGIRKNLEMYVDSNDYMNVARTLARLHRSGIRLKKEKQEAWFEQLRDTDHVERYREDPRKLALYYSYLKRVGAIEEAGIERQDQDIFSNYYTEQVSGKAEKYDKDFSRFCASMKFLGLREDFTGAREMVGYEVEAARKETRGGASNEVRSTLSEGELNLRLARQKYLFGGELSTEDNETTFKEVEAAQGEKKWGKYLRNLRLYRYVSGNEVEVDHSTKRHLWSHLRELRGKVQKYLSFAGDLTHLLLAERNRKYRPEEIVEDSLDSPISEEDASIGVGEEEEVDEDTSATGAHAGDTAVIDKLEIPEDAELKPLEREASQEREASEERSDATVTSEKRAEKNTSFEDIHVLATKHPDLLQRYTQAQEEISRSVDDSGRFRRAVQMKHQIMREIRSHGLTVGEDKIRRYIEAMADQDETSKQEQEAPLKKQVEPTKEKLQLIDEEINRLHRVRPDLIREYVKAKMRAEKLLPPPEDQEVSNEQKMQDVLNEIGEHQFVVTKSRLDELYDKVVQQIGRQVKSGAKKLLIETVRQRQQNMAEPVEQLFARDMFDALKGEWETGQPKLSKQEIERWVKTHDAHKKERNEAVEGLIQQGYDPDSESVKKRRRDIRRKNEKQE